MVRTQTLTKTDTRRSKAIACRPTVENVWRFLRDNQLSNRVLKSYDDIVAHCRESWSDLMDQPWRISSISRRE